jgi:hypothetical protein
MTGAAMMSVTDGREAVGFILGRGKAGFEAFTRDEVSLGYFKTAAEAANAIFNASNARA